MIDRVRAELAAAARVLLEHTARASVAPVVASLGDVQSVFLVRSGGLDQLGTFLTRLQVLAPGATLRVVGRPGDAAVIPQFWPGPWSCHELAGDAFFEWSAIQQDVALCTAARACEAHLFLMRNVSATGYDNVQDIMMHLAGHHWFAVTPDDRVVRFDAATLDDLRTHTRLREAIVEWAARLPPA